MAAIRVYQYTVNQLLFIATYIGNQDVDHMENRIQVRGVWGPVWGKKNSWRQGAPKTLENFLHANKSWYTVKNWFKFQSIQLPSAVCRCRRFFLPPLDFLGPPFFCKWAFSLYNQNVIVQRTSNCLKKN